MTTADQKQGEAMSGFDRELAAWKRFQRAKRCICRGRGWYFVPSPAVQTHYVRDDEPVEPPPPSRKAICAEHRNDMTEADQALLKDAGIS